MWKLIPWLRKPTQQDFIDVFISSECTNIKMYQFLTVMSAILYFLILLRMYVHTCLGYYCIMCLNSKYSNTETISVKMDHYPFIVLWVGFGFRLLSCGLGCVWVAWKSMGFIYFKSKMYAQLPPVIQPPPMLTQYECHTLTYKYPPLLLPHTDSEMFLIICELIDKLLRSLGGDHDGCW